MEHKLIPTVVVGFGTIGHRVVSALQDGIADLELIAIGVRDPNSSRLTETPQAVEFIAGSEASMHGQLIVDCASSGSFAEVAEPVIRGGKTLVTVNSAALLARMDLVDMAAATGARIIIPSGGILGLDAVRAAAEGQIMTAEITTRKPPRALKAAKYVVEHQIDLDRLTEPVLLFQGSAREAARLFPDNVNVAASLSLAGIGPDRTAVQIWADPACTVNSHTVEVECDAGRFTMTISSSLFAQKAVSGRMTPQSVIACLRGLHATLRVGS
ncbi:MULTISPECIES: aspartate dehydrogenase [unclassified Mesorhizobium]|uniref:aspartate dehydrogenase n=1 Tax=unclassified Mesorhizobium TaxID=325217 RepID=UPI001092CCB0|nr:MULTISPECIES: aspartate dehydrogenase [unclassified Mesorhizobium]TGS43766.1 aspartate dehydrogenase [Mesorhizobium sp. M8A.F.Ca.ET.182.01.1.1]TGS78347.1 aspartate dehydrogenase [Mesorhizobium sp. M8A.F.Ca.ET.181.01.1.1]TGV15485.1 aspartate dehydrogenase [Mesorhizobium sp. M8A.F.Ca.ET.173.01.1.1]